MSFPLFGSMCADGPFLPHCCQLATRSQSPSPVTTRDFWHSSQTRELTPHICVIVPNISPSVTHHLMLFSSSANSFHATVLRSGLWAVPGSGLTSPAFLRSTSHASQDPVNRCLGHPWELLPAVIDSRLWIVRSWLLFLVAFDFILVKPRPSVRKTSCSVQQISLMLLP